MDNKQEDCDDSVNEEFINLCEYYKDGFCIATWSKCLNFICSLFEVNALDNKNIKP